MRSEADPRLEMLRLRTSILAGLVGWGVNARKGHQRFLGMKTAHIANFSHELRAESRANTKHLHPPQDTPAEKPPGTASPV